MSAPTEIVTTARQARELLGETGGGTSPRRGEELYNYVRRERPAEILELGFAHGVSTVYLAAALEANHAGHLTSVDLQTARDRDPSAEEMLQRAGLSARVELVYEETSYNWFLWRQLRSQLQNSTIVPRYDFVFIDGAHTWVDDGFAFFLVDRLLKPGGRILFDDLSWHMDERWADVPTEERELEQVREVVELLVATHPGYDELQIDADWAWARRSPTAQPDVRVVVRRDLIGSLRELSALARQRLRR